MVESQSSSTDWCVPWCAAAVFGIVALHVGGGGIRRAYHVSQALYITHAAVNIC